MIPTIYAKTETAFTGRGLGGVPEATECIVTERLNQSNELTLRAPLNALHADEIRVGNLIVADTNKTLKRQPYEIIRVERTLDGIAVEAQHVAYRLAYSITRSAFTASTASAALAKCATSGGNLIEGNGFTFETDLTGSGSFSAPACSRVWDLLAGIEGSILDVFGGEYEFNRFKVKLLKSRGADRGVTIKYGKNLTAIGIDANSGEEFDGVYPIWTDSDGIIQRRGSQIWTSAYRSLLGYARTIVRDYSDEFETIPTQGQLDTCAQRDVNGRGAVIQTINGSFVPLWQTLEYRDIANVEPVSMADTVRFVVPSMGIDISTKVIETEWDVLRERYQSVQVGDVSQRIIDAIRAIK